MVPISSKCFLIFPHNICSIILLGIDPRIMGQYWLGSVFFLFLKISGSFVFLQSVSTIYPNFSCLLKKNDCQWNGKGHAGASTSCMKHGFSLTRALVSSLPPAPFPHPSPWGRSSLNSRGLSTGVFILHPRTGTRKYRDYSNSSSPDNWLPNCSWLAEHCIQRRKAAPAPLSAPLESSKLIPESCQTVARGAVPTVPHQA